MVDRHAIEKNKILIGCPSTNEEPRTCIIGPAHSWKKLQGSEDVGFSERRQSCKLSRRKLDDTDLVRRLNDVGTCLDRNTL